MTLHVAVVHFNPCRFIAPVENYKRFLHEMKQWDVKLHCMEALWEDQTPVNPDAEIVVHAGPEHLMWQKERMINHIVSQLDPAIDRVAWIDADMMFVNRHWVGLAKSYLDIWKVVQLFDDWYFEDAQGKLSDHGVGCGKWGLRYLHSKTLQEGRGLPGGAWAARREVFPISDLHILGGGDGNSLDAWLGRWDSYGIYHLTSQHKAAFKPWFEHADQLVHSSVNNIPGSAVHYRHGSKENRAYKSRIDILKDHAFDPAVHIAVDPENGLWRWTDQASGALREAIAGYFINRREDN